MRAGCVDFKPRLGGEGVGLPLLHPSWVVRADRGGLTPFRWALRFDRPLFQGGRHFSGPCLASAHINTHLGGARGARIAAVGVLLPGELDRAGRPGVWAARRESDPGRAARDRQLDRRRSPVLGPGNLPPRPLPLQGGDRRARSAAPNGHPRQRRVLPAHRKMLLRDGRLHQGPSASLPS